MVLGIQPLEPYGSASLFAYAIEENDKLIDLQRSASTWLGPDEDTLIIMSCYQRRQLGLAREQQQAPLLRSDTCGIRCICCARRAIA